MTAHDDLISADSGEPTGARTPADALGEPKRMSTNDNVEQESYGCPSCTDSFDTENGMKAHHAMVHGESIAGVSCECAVCGDEFSVPPSEADGRKYCSESCMAAGYEDRVTLVCEVCHEEYTVPPSRKDSSRFCSRECALGTISDERRSRVGVVCAWCGTQVEKRPCEADLSERHFCDHSCYAEWLSENRSGKDSPHWKGGPAPYGPGWHESKREAVRERDGRECVDCGMSETKHVKQFGERLHVHHVIPAREVDDPEQRNAMDNLVTLCQQCHGGKWEGIPVRPEVV